MNNSTKHTELRKLAEAATPGPWEQDCSVKSEGTYGSGEDAGEGYDTYEVFQTLTGKRLFDFLNSEVAEVQEEYDEDGKTAWDAAAKADAAFIVAFNPETALSLLDLIDRQREALAGMLDNFGGYCCPEVDTAITVMQEAGIDRWSMQSQIESTFEIPK